MIGRPIFSPAQHQFEDAAKQVARVERPREEGVAIGIDKPCRRGLDDDQRAQAGLVAAQVPLEFDPVLLREGDDRRGERLARQRFPGAPSVRRRHHGKSRIAQHRGNDHALVPIVIDNEDGWLLTRHGVIRLSIQHWRISYPAEVKALLTALARRENSRNRPRLFHPRQNRGIVVGGRVPLPVGRAGFKPVGGRAGVFGRFDSCLFRQSRAAAPCVPWLGVIACLSIPQMIPLLECLIDRARYPVVFS